MGVINATTLVGLYTNLNSTVMNSKLVTTAASAFVAATTAATAKATSAATVVVDATARTVNAAAAVINATAAKATSTTPPSLVTASMEIIADSMTTIASNEYNNNFFNSNVNDADINGMDYNSNENQNENGTDNFDLVQTLANFAAKTLTVNATTAEDFLSNQNLTTTMTTAANATGSGSLEHAPKLSRGVLIKVIVLTVMAIVSLLGNIATMWNIYKTRMTRRASRHTWSAIYSLIFHLSIADVLVTGFCLIGEAAWSFTVQWYANEYTCKFVKLFQMFSLYLSTYVLVLVGVDRWIAVKYPMKSLNMAKRCYRLLGGTYVLSFVLSLPQFFIFRVAKGPFVEDFHQCVTHGFYTAEWQEQLYTTFTLFFTFIIPLCVLVITYLSTFRTISGSEKMFQGSKLAVYPNKPNVQTNRQRLIHKAKMKSLRISVVIIVAFLICWTPYNVMMIIFTFLNPDKRFGEELQSGIFFFGMSNSLVNPLIYGAFHLCPLKRKNSKYNQCSITRDNSQRSPSVMTAVTQVDSNGRQTRTFRQPSCYRTNLHTNNNETFNLLSRPSPRSHLRRGTGINSVGHPLMMNYNQGGSSNGYMTPNENVSSV